MKSRNRKLVVNREFQYHYALFSVFTAVFLINILIIASVFLPGVTGLSLALGYSHVFIIAAIELALIGGVWYASLRAGRNIAGTVYVIGHNLEKLGNGDLSFEMHLRKHDAFQESVDIMNSAVTNLRNRILSLRKLASDMEANAETDEVRQLAAQMTRELASFRTEAQEEKTLKTDSPEQQS
jgi:methyl-accepting chemotaxis protein